MLYSGRMRYFLTYILLLLSLPGFGQQAQDSVVKKAPLQGLSISGNYRFYAQHRMFSDAYTMDVVDGNPVLLDGRSILTGDATQLPELTLNINGKPTSKTSFGTDLVVWNQNNGEFDYYRNLQLGINLYGSFETDFANVGVKAGGLHWHSMTPFTMRSFSGYNRYSVYERNPWDPQFQQIDRRYSEYHKVGAIAQDTRWSQQAVQGIILDFTELPLGLSMNLMYGKTQNAGSAFTTQTNDQNDSTNNAFLRPFQNTVPNNVIGARVMKNFKKHSVSLNTFNRRTYSDALATEAIENHIHTTEFNLDFNKIKLYGEIGAAKYSDVNQDLGWGEMASLKIKFSESLTKFPFEIHAWRISPNAVNNNGEFVNTSVNEAVSASSGETVVIGANGVLQQNGSAMLGLGQMANNRQGLNLNAGFQIQRLHLHFWQRLLERNRK